jgi:hypothetical protein
MIEEIRRHVSFLRTGERVLPGVQAKFAEFHRWALEQLRTETVWEPRTEPRKIKDSGGRLTNGTEHLPPRLIRSGRYLALERLLVALATIPRLPPAERRKRADEIVEACQYLDEFHSEKPDLKTDNQKQNRIISDDARSIAKAFIKAKKQGKAITQKQAIARYVARFPKKQLSQSSLEKQVREAVRREAGRPDK